jgi:predicted permease
MQDDRDRHVLNEQLGGAYQIVRELGRGAFATVYLARERVLHRLVAIKVLHLERAVSDEERERFMREARTAAHLDHPGVVPILAFGETPTTMYMVMRYIDGESLADRLKRETRLPSDEARRLLLDLASTLAHAHRQGVVHRDIKPENVLLTRGEGGEAHARLLDFGVAAFQTRDLGMSTSREMWGTPTFMSPEQALGEVDLDARSDIYSLGVLGYVMLAGRDPFTSTSPLERLKQQQRGPVIPLARAAPGAPAGLVAAIERCLAYEPQERWRRAADLHAALAGLGGQPVSRIASGWRRALARAAGVPRAGRRRRERRAAFFQAPPSPRLLLEALRNDLEYAARGFAKTPGFTAAVILTLAIGLGATTVVFSAIEALLLRELPVRDPDALVVLQEDRRGPNDAASFGTSLYRYDRYLAYREATTDVLTGLAAQAFESFSVRLGTEARPINGLATSGNYFEVLGVRPALGRFYTAAQDRPGGAEPVVVVGYDFWQRALQSDPAAVGRTLFLDSRPMTIIGVAPPGFNGAFVGIFAFDAWVPVAAYQRPPPSSAAVSPGASYEWMNLFGRLRPGVDISRASAVLRVTGARVPTEDPKTRIANAWVEPLTALPAEMRKPVQGFMNMLLAVAAVVLLIAATNTAGMLLARAAARRREVATRLAVGASRSRLVAQFLVESTLLCVAAGVTSLLLTWWLTRVLNGWQPPFPIEPAVAFGLNGTVLAAAAATVLGTALLAGLAPAMQGAEMDLAAAMKEGGPQSGVRRTRLRSAFVVAQVALSVSLLAVAGLFVRSLQRALAIDPGFEAAGVVHAGLSLGPHGYDKERSRVLFAQLLERVRARPEVAAASLANAAPLSGNTRTWGARRPGRPDDEEVDAQWGVADVGFIELLRAPLLAGRTFTSADGPTAPSVTVINETLARRLWPGESAQRVLGRELESLSGRRMTVIGVIRKGKYTFLQEEERAYGYVPFAQGFSGSPQLYVRARGEPAGALRAAREELAKLDPNIALERPTLLAADVERYVLPQRIGALSVGLFGSVGLVLAATGLYGVLAYGVTQRLREFGVRMALGARAVDVVRLVVRHGLMLVAVGVAIGLVGAFVAGRLVASFLFGLNPADPVTFAAVPIILGAVALLAGIIPARRAAAADPMASLRVE